MTLPLLRSPLFEDLAHVRAGFSTRHGGVSAPPYASLNLSLKTDDEPGRIRANQRLLVQAAGFPPERLALARQVHGADVKVVTTPGLFPGFDALVTRQPGLLLGIGAADCAAVLLADPARGVVGACHAGWRGTVAGVVPRTVEAMARLGAHPAALRAFVSPCISVAHFEVGAEVAAQFDAAFVYRSPAWPRPHVDLKAAVAAQLTAAGLRPEHVDVSPRCTFAEVDTFFSYRAEQGRTGGMMGFIGLRAG